MSFDLATCEHAGYCGDRFTNWRRLAREARPGGRRAADADGAAVPVGRARDAARGRRGAARARAAREHRRRAGRALWVRGSIPVTSADGETYEVRNRVTLCRCGQSETKPFCDGHKHVGFRDG